MKQYYLTTLYSQAMQVAVQQDHALKRMVRDLMREPESHEAKVFNEYIDKHETTVCLGVSQPTELLALYSFMHKHKDELKIPVNYFQEPSMNNTFTCLTFITNEKLSHPIAGEVLSLMRKEGRTSLYDMKDGETFGSETDSLFFKVLKGDSFAQKFEVTFKKILYKSMQNEELMESNLNDENLEKIYESLNKEDFMFYNEDSKGISGYEYKTVTETYTLAEFNFLLKLRKFNLK